MALSILGLFAMQAARGTLSDPSLPIGFAAIAVVAALLAGLALSPWRGREPASNKSPGSAPEDRLWRASGLAHSADGRRLWTGK